MSPLPLPLATVGSHLRLQTAKFVVRCDATKTEREPRGQTLYHVWFEWSLLFCRTAVLVLLDASFPLVCGIAPNLEEVILLSQQLVGEGAFPMIFRPGHRRIAHLEGKQESLRGGGGCDSETHTSKQEVRYTS